jgi:hypothetical protein
MYHEMLQGTRSIQDKQDIPLLLIHEGCLLEAMDFPEALIDIKILFQQKITLNSISKLLQWQALQRQPK